MIIAIFGASSTGKTSVARIIAQNLSLPLRSCGEIVKQAASELQVSREYLPDYRHYAIDTETVAWIRARAGSGGGLVEGRFLDQVLVPVPDMVQLVEIRCFLSVRANRWAGRFGRCGTDEMERQDVRDVIFRQSMYKEVVPLSPVLVIENSEITADGCAEWLESHMKQWRAQLA